MNVFFFLACIYVACLLLWEAMGIAVNEWTGWQARTTLSQIAEGNVVFGLVLLCSIFLAVGAISFHIIERTGLTK